MFGGKNLLVKAIILHFLSISPKSVHYSIDLSMVDPVGYLTLATKVQHAGALFWSLLQVLGFEGRAVQTAAIQI